MATKDTNYLVAVHKGLDESLEKQVAALPEKFNKQRFLQNCMTVLQDGQADFSKCEAPTVVRTLLKGAFLGLDFFNGECYAIPYGNQCQFQTDYKGEIKLCKRYSSNPIQDIYAKVVREGDKFEEVIENGKQYVNFRPKTFSNGEIIGAFAVVLYKDGSMMYDTMSKEDIEHTRQTFSKAANSNESIRDSDFLRGKNRNGWTITFDWFMLPNNFPKVLDGNYANPGGQKQRTGDAKLDRLYNRVSEVDDWV